MNLSKLRILLILFGLSLSICLYAQEGQDLQLARQYFENAEYEKAADLLENLFRNDGSVEVFDLYLKNLIALKDFNGAEKIVKRQMKRRPEDITLYVDLGWVYLQTGDESKARKTFEQSIDKLEANQSDIVLLAHSFVIRKQNAYALKVYQKGKNLMKGVYPFNMETAEIYQSMGDLNGAIEEYLGALNWSESLLSQIQFIIQSMIGDETGSPKAEILRVQLLKKIQQQPDKTVFTELLIWFFIQQKDYESALVQSKAYDKRMKGSGSKVLQLAQLAFSSEEYDVAVKCYEYEIEKGKESPYYVFARTQLLESLTKKMSRTGGLNSGDMSLLKQAYEKALAEMGEQASTINLMRGYAHLKAFYLNEASDAESILEKALEFSGTDPLQLAECKLELGDILVFRGEMWESSLLYSQVEKAFKHEVIGQEAKYRNARLSYYKGEFEWAQAQLDVLKAATSKLISNDALNLALVIQDNTADSNYVPLGIFARAELLVFQNLDSMAVRTLDSISMKFPGHSLEDDVYYQKYLIANKRGKYAEAAENLNKIYSNYGEDLYGDDALFKLAELNQYKFNLTDTAQKMYQKLLITYPGSVYCTEARKRFRKLRGDEIN